MVLKRPEAGVSDVAAAFQCYGPQLRRFLLRRINRAQDAEDVIQEVFLRLLRITDSDFIRNPRAYIYGMALHVVREFKMRELKAGTRKTLEPQALIEMAEHPENISPDELGQQLDIERQLEGVLRRLPLAQRTVFLLHKRDGYSYEEIAAKLKISTHTVDKYLLQAKVRIRTLHWER